MTSRKFYHGIFILEQEITKVWSYVYGICMHVYTLSLLSQPSLLCQVVMATYSGLVSVLLHAHLLIIRLLLSYAVLPMVCTARSRLPVVCYSLPICNMSALLAYPVCYV